MIEPFIATFTGGKFYPLGPDEARIDIRDIAHALSQQCRYAGHTSSFWSVAAHSLEVSRRVESHFDPRSPDYNHFVVRLVALTALLHDASEAYLQDIVRPVKPLMFGYKQWEENVERVIATKFSLPFPWPPLIKQIDDSIVLDEVANFFPHGSAAWKRYGITREKSTLLPLSPAEAERQFLARFDALTGVRPSPYEHPDPLTGFRAEVSL